MGAVSSFNKNETQSQKMEEVPSYRKNSLANNIAFGLRQTVVCFATDFIDPVVGTWMQKNQWLQTKFKPRRPGEDVAHQPWYGEVAGDTASFFTFLATKQLFARPLRHVYEKVERLFDKSMTKRARKQLRLWQAETGLDEASDAYQQKLAELKFREARDSVDSLIIATESTVANVAAQRYLFNNPSNTMLILLSKLVGAVATVAAMFGLGRIVPTTMQSLDDEVADRYAAPLIRGTQKLFGVTPEAANEAPAVVAASPAEHLLRRSPMVTRPLAEDKRLQFVRDMVRLADMDGMAQASDAQLQQWLKEQQQRLHALEHAFGPDHAVARTFAQAFDQAIERLVPKYYDATMAATSAQSILNNRRDDAHAMRLLLNDGAFVQEMMQAIRTQGAQLPPKNPAARLEKDVQQLLQQGEPAVHIYGTAYGQYVVHKALVSCFQPNGVLEHALTQHLQQASPQEDPARLARFARDYITARREAAEAVVQDMKPHGLASVEAVRRSEALRIERAKPVSHEDERAKPVSHEDGRGKPAAEQSQSATQRLLQQRAQTATDHSLRAA